MIDLGVDSEPKSSAAREPALDGIRGLAVLLVLFHHLAVFGPLTDKTLFERVAFKLGLELAMGVDLFFVLSGFLITRILLASKSRPGFFKNFYIRRTLRIFPLYYLFVALIFLVVPHFLGKPPFQEAAALLNKEASFQRWYWLYVPNMHLFSVDAWVSPMTDHCWSLAVEEQFYLFWPWLVYFLSESGLMTATGLLLFGSIGLRAYLVLHGHGDAAVRSFTPDHLDGLMLGAALAQFYRRGVKPDLWNRAALACVAAGSACRLWLILGHQGPGMDQWKQIFIIASWSLIFVGLVAKVISAPATHAARGIFSGMILTSLGTYSYGLYLFHQPLFYLGQEYVNGRNGTDAGNWTLFLLGPVLASFLTAWALFRYFETPFLNLKERFN